MKNILNNLRQKINLSHPWGKSTPAFAGVTNMGSEQLETTPPEAEADINSERNSKQDSQINSSNYDISYNASTTSTSRAKTWLNKLKFDPRRFGRIRTGTDSGFVFSKKILLVLSLVGIALIGILSYIFVFFPKNNPQKSTAASQIVDNRAAVAGAKSQQNINREFAFPLRDDKNQEVAKIKYLIESAELRNEILVKGQRATAIQGKSFLIVNLKVTNEYSKPVEINTRDYVRFVLGDSVDQMAADIHSDPVVIQAASTKLTRIGLTIDDAVAKKIKLMIGEIKGDKQTIDVQF